MTTSILERIASGDGSAVEECLDRYSSLVWALARRYSWRADDAEDAVQEIFIDLWKSAARFDPDVASEKTFVAMIARRRLIDRGRRNQRQPLMEELPETLAEETGNEPKMEKDLALSQVAEELSRLKPEHHRVLEMSVVEGFTHSEISSRLEVPLGTVKTIIRRGLQRVRERLVEASGPEAPLGGGEELRKGASL